MLFFTDEYTRKPRTLAHHWSALLPSYYIRHSSAFSIIVKVTTTIRQAYLENASHVAIRTIVMERIVKREKPFCALDMS